MATTAPQYDFFVTLEDLMFILDQVKIAEQTTNPDGTIDGEALRDAVNPLLPFGLRTVDGTWNNLLPGMERRVRPTTSCRGWYPGTLQVPQYDSTPFIPGTTRSTRIPQPRIISNLIVDQTASNPAAVIAAARPGRQVDLPRAGDGAGLRRTARCSSPTSRPTSACRRRSTAS